jgi:phage gp36-like protein
MTDMAYCSESDLLQMIPQAELAELTAESGEIPDSQVVTEAIQRAGGEIDAYLGARYRLPLSPVPDQVKGLAVDLALYHLYARRSVVPPVRRQRYEAAVTFLRQVAAGLAVLEGEGVLVSERERVASEFVGAPRIFTRTSQRDW